MFVGKNSEFLGVAVKKRTEFSEQWKARKWKKVKGK
jgi:hypothetical protein